MFKVLGTSDDVTTCDRCGKCNLKRTVALESDATGIVRYGVDCAARAIHGSNTAHSRRSIECQAFAADHAAATMRRGKLARVARDMNQANRLYARTGRSLAASYFARRASGEIVRVDGSDDFDAAFYQGEGFERN